MITFLLAAFMLRFWCHKNSCMLVLGTSTQDLLSLLLNLNPVLEQPHLHWISTSAVILYFILFSSIQQANNWSIYLWTEGLLLLLSRTGKEALMKPDLIILSHFLQSFIRALNLLFFLYERALACPLFSPAISLLEKHINVSIHPLLCLSSCFILTRLHIKISYPKQE